MEVAAVMVKMHVEILGAGVSEVTYVFADQSYEGAVTGLDQHRIAFTEHIINMD